MRKGIGISGMLFGAVLLASIGTAIFTANGGISMWKQDGQEISPIESYNVTVNGTFDTTATTTTAESFDGFIAYADFVTIATGTAKAVYTNTGSPLICDSDAAYIYYTVTGFAPSLDFSMGSTTSATGYSTNLIASSTAATTSPGTTGRHFLQASDVGLFRLESGHSITGAISDITNTEASSTYFSNYDAELAVPCWIAGG